MKITVIGPVYPYRGGIAHFTTSLGAALKKQGQPVQMISFKSQYPQWLYPGKSDKDTGPGRARLEAQFSLSPLNPFSWNRTFNTILRFKPDLVVLQWWVTFWAPAMGYLARQFNKHGLPFVYIIHNSLPHEPRFFDPLLARLALVPGRRFIVMNDRETSRIRALVKHACSITKCPLPIFSVFPDTGTTKKQARSKLTLPETMKLVLFYGIIRKYKGLKNLLEAVSILIGRGNKEIGLVIAGEFWDDKQEYLDLIAEYGLSDHVWIMDRFVSDLETSLLFTATDLYVGPYLDGTQSASIKTALSFGSPMVVTSVVADEIVNQYPKYCRVIKSADPALLADNITEMINSPRIPPKEIERLSAKSWENLIGSLMSGT
jgi:D-inositol-3-phosphate glycosyltransferase